MFYSWNFNRLYKGVLTHKVNYATLNYQIKNTDIPLKKLKEKI